MKRIVLLIAFSVLILAAVTVHARWPGRTSARPYATPGTHMETTYLLFGSDNLTFGADKLKF